MLSPTEIEKIVKKSEIFDQKIAIFSKKLEKVEKKLTRPLPPKIFSAYALDDHISE